MTLLLIIAIIVETLVIVVGVFKIRAIKYDGNMVLTETDEKKTFSFEVKTDPESWTKKDHIILKVTRGDE